MRPPVHITRFELLEQQLLACSAGDSSVIEAVVKDDDCNSYDLSGHRVVMTFKVNKRDSDAEAIIHKETGQGIAIIDPTKGILHIHVTAVDTKKLQAQDALFWDLRIIAPESHVSTVAEGRLNIRKPVTSTIQ